MPPPGQDYGRNGGYAATLDAGVDYDRYDGGGYAVGAKPPMPGGPRPFNTIQRQPTYKQPQMGTMAK